MIVLISLNIYNTCLDTDVGLVETGFEHITERESQNLLKAQVRDSVFRCGLVCWL